MAIALYPGAYKPPHRGHFEVVNSLLKGTYKGKVYNLGNYKEVGLQGLQGVTDKVEPITKVVVFIGGGNRNGISPEISQMIWEVYKNYLPGDVEIIHDQMNPLASAKDYAKANPNEQFYAITGIRSEEDISDLRRVSMFNNTDNVEGLMITSAGDQSQIRATDFRKNLLSGNLDKVIDFFPKGLSRKEILQIVNKLKDAIIAENMRNAMNETFNNMFESKEEKVKEGTSGAPIAPQSAQRSEDRQRLEYLYKYLSNLVPEPYQVIFNQDHLLVKDASKDVYASKTVYEGVDTNKLTQYIGSILEYMIDQKMNITPLPEVKIKRDAENAANFFGRTAYYDPNNKEVVLYVEGRHPKDICRSFVHEMIHHIQNIEGRLGNIQTSNTNEDDHLMEIEKEAYLRGNITFRNWEDSIKNQDDKVVTENTKYDEYEELASELAQDYTLKLFNSRKNILQKKTTIERTIDGQPFSFKLDVILALTDEVSEIEAEAFATTDSLEPDDDYKEDDLIEVQIAVNPKLKKHLEIMELTLFHFLVHEMEHLVHGEGLNRVTGKHIKEDPKIRTLINQGMLPAYQYRLLPREIASAVREFAAKAKATGNSFAEEVNAELDKERVTPQERITILNAYRKYIKKNNLDLEL